MYTKNTVIYNTSILITALFMSTALTAHSPESWHSRHSLSHSHVKERLETLKPLAKIRAIERLNRFSIPHQDLNDIEIDDDGEILYADKIVIPETILSLPSPQTSMSTGEVFSLHSNPGATNTIFLDFNGHEISGTKWNPTDAGGNEVVYNTLPYDIDNSPQSFSQIEIDNIAAIWHRVAEDYAPFDVDVTTEEPPSFTSSTGRILITKSQDANGLSMPYSDFGGSAYVDVWGAADFEYYQPALVYYDNLGAGSPKYVAESASHEMGHILGLSHDGTSTQSYYNGQGKGYTRWGPIMGLGYNKHVTQWSKGDYPDANNTQDDISIIAEKLGFRADDHGDDIATASQLYIDSTGKVTATTPENDPGNLYPDNKGIVSTRSDTDVFELHSGNGQIELTVTPAWIAYKDNRARGANLDVLAVLLDDAGREIIVANPAEETSATISYSARAGTYFLKIYGVGDGDSTYSDYGSEGLYFINGSVPVAAIVDDNNPHDNNNPDDNSNGDDQDEDIAGYDSGNGGEASLQFIANDFSSYGGKQQDVKGEFTVADGGRTLKLIGNLWKALPLVYTITPETVLQFDFSSNYEGELHGIGFDNDKVLSEPYFFQISGSHFWGIQDFNNYSGKGDLKTYQIPVGQYYLGEMKYLFFVMDDDTGNLKANSVISNIRVFESGTQAVNTNTPPAVTITNPSELLTISEGTAINLTALANDKEDGDLTANIQWSTNITGHLGSGTDLNIILTKGQHVITALVTDSSGETATDQITVGVNPPQNNDQDNNHQNNDEHVVFYESGFASYGGSSQDVNGIVTLSDDGHSAMVTGNAWKIFPLSYNITPSTIIEFDFSSQCRGEIHGIGLDLGVDLNERRLFQLCGSQTWGIQSFNNYEGDGTSKRYQIPVGQYYRGAQEHLVLAMDHDVSNPSGQIKVSNLRIYDSATTPEEPEKTRRT